MAEACGAETSMDEGAFGAHIDEIAVKFKDQVAKVAASTVLLDAQDVQMFIDDQIRYENENAQYEWQVSGTSDNPPSQITKGSDNGYEYIVGTYYQELVDDYKTNYEVDLLTFNPGSASNAEDELKNVHLTWIPELFARAASVPQPSRVDAPIETLNSVAGADELVDVSTNDEGGLDVGDADSTALGGSMLGAAVDADTSSVRNAVDSWHSGTAKVFKQNFLPKIPVAGAHQINVIKALRNLLGVHYGLVKVARADIDSLAHTALEAAEGYDDCCGGGGDATTWIGLAGAVLTIAGAVSALASAGTSLALVAAGVKLLSGTVSAAKNLDNLKPEPDDVGGESLDDLVENVRTMAEKIWSDLDKAYSDLGGGMDSLAGLCEGNTVLVAPRPEGADGEPGFGDYGPDDVNDVTS